MNILNDFIELKNNFKKLRTKEHQQLSENNELEETKIPKTKVFLGFFLSSDDVLTTLKKFSSKNPGQIRKKSYLTSGPSIRSSIKALFAATRVI